MDVDVDKEGDVDVYEFESKVGGFEMNLCEVCLMQSCATGLITTQDHLMDLV